MTRDNITETQYRREVRRNMTAIRNAMSNIESLNEMRTSMPSRPRKDLTESSRFIKKAHQALKRWWEVY